MSAHPRVPLSVLDLAVVPAGGTGAQAVRAAVDLAVDLDRLGYRRVWYAEHHLSPGVGSAAPAVLAAAVAARTRRIRVGSGAVLLSTTSPLVAAEQFGTIAALHPGRVDLGLGRAAAPPDPGAARGTGAAPAARTALGARVVDGLYVPGPPPVAGTDSVLRERLLAQHRVVGASRTPAPFREELELVLGLRAGTYAAADGTRHVAPPVTGADLELWVLASSAGESARVAGALGLPLAANFHVSPATTLDTIAAYRAAFRPGALDRPYVVVSADVLVAPTTEHARALAAPFADWVLSIRRGAAGAVPYPRPDDAVPWEARDADERAVVADRVDTRVVGAPADVVARLETLQRVTGADELLITTATHDPADTRRSFALLAEAWGVTAGEADADTPARGPAPGPALRSPAEAAAAVADGALLVDVRSAGGRAAHGGIPDATVADRTDLDALFGPAHAPVVSIDTPVVVVCGSVAGSGPVAEALAARGYAVSHVAGGFPAWRDAGLPTEPPAGAVVPADPVGQPGPAALPAAGPR